MSIFVDKVKSVISFEKGIMVELGSDIGKT